MRRNLWSAGLIVFVSYLLWGSGFVSDDFADLMLLKFQGSPDFLVPRHNFINVPLGHFTHHIWFRYFEVGGHLIDLAKIFWTSLSIFFIYRFICRFHDPGASFLITFLFAFHPSHDSIPFWYAPSGHLVALGIYFEAYNQCCEARPKLATLLALSASFMVYSSTPVAAALGLLCLLQKQNKRFWILVTPNLLYIAYFLGVSHLAQLAPSRFLEPLSWVALLKNLFLQAITFVDALLGPSFLFKLYYSTCELGPFSILIGLSVCVVTWRYLIIDQVAPRAILLSCFTTLTFLSWLMFSFTGRYPQLAFNLGNRSTFWGSLLVTYLFVVTPAPRWVRMSGVTILLFSILGISDHWRSWQLHQTEIMAQVKENRQLDSIEIDDLVLVTGNQYSQLGPFAHIEFLSEDWVVSNLFVLAGRTCKRALPLNRYKYVENGLYQSRKKNRDAWRLKEKVWVYDSESDLLSQIDAGELNGLVERMQSPCRHWSQLSDNTFTEKARTIVYYLMPRLRGALSSNKPKTTDRRASVVPRSLVAD